MEMNKKEVDRAWSTKSELTFIKGLGTWASKKQNRLGLLKQYQSTLPLRGRWGNVDDVDVYEYLTKLIAVDTKALFK
jgi:hypothetical protein